MRSDIIYSAFLHPTNEVSNIYRNEKKRFTRVMLELPKPVEPIHHFGVFEYEDLHKRPTWLQILIQQNRIQELQINLKGSK